MATEKKMMKIYLTEDTFKKYLEDCVNMCVQSVPGKIKYVNDCRNAIVSPLEIEIMTFKDYLTVFAVEFLFSCVEDLKTAKLEDVDRIVKNIQGNDLFVTNINHAGVDFGLDNIPFEIRNRLNIIASTEDLSNVKCFLVDISDFEFSVNGGESK